MRKSKDTIPIRKAIALLTGAFVVVVLVIGGLYYMLFFGHWRVVQMVEPDIVTDDTQDEPATNLTGTWRTATANNNDESVVLTFSGNRYTKVSETKVAADAAYIYKALDDVDAFYDGYDGAPIMVEPDPESGTIVRVTTAGAFVLSGNEIAFVGDDGVVAVYACTYADNTLTIDGEVFIRDE